MIMPTLGIGRKRASPGRKSLADALFTRTQQRVLGVLADILRQTVRASDVVCRLGGEEFGVIMASCDAGDAMGLATRLTERMVMEEFEQAGRLTLSIGIAQGPEHAMNPRELVVCAESAMMAAKARGKNQSVFFDDTATERPSVNGREDVRSIAHLKMLQSLAGRLNRLNDVNEIGSVIVNELHGLIGRDVALEVIRHDPGPPEPDLALFGMLAAILEQADPGSKGVPLLMPGVSDGRFFARLGIQTYGFTPMRLPADFNFWSGVHGADERIPADAVEFGTRAIGEALRRHGTGP